jgi:hypothetical protein
MDLIITCKTYKRKAPHRELGRTWPAAASERTWLLDAQSGGLRREELGRGPCVDLEQKTKRIGELYRFDWELNTGSRWCISGNNQMSYLLLTIRKTSRAK